MTKWKGRMIPIAALAIVSVIAASAGATTICDVQAAGPNGASPLEGQTVTVRGAITILPGLFQPLYSSFYIEANGCGVNLFDYDPVPFAVALGDTVEVTGVVTEYNGTTEITYSSISFVSHGPEPVPTYKSLRELPAEENEGRLLETIGVITDQSQWYFYIEQPWSHASVQVYQSNTSIDMGVFAPGDTVDVIGLLVQYDSTPPYTEGWELAPRTQDDIKLAVPPPPPDPEFAAKARLMLDARTFRPELDEVIPITYLAPERSSARMEIYDLQGHLVRTLTQGDYTGYENIPEYFKPDFFMQGTYGWDGRDDLRRLVPAGVYLCRLEVETRDGNESVDTAPIVVGARLGE
jgi:hypothetical protein